MVILLLCPSTAVNGADVETGILEIRVVDAATDRPCPARLRIRDCLGLDHIPADSVSVPIAKDKWFVCSGRMRTNIIVGKASLRIERGTEYRPVIEVIDIAADTTARHEVKLERWIHMSELGYASGENHLHVPGDGLSGMLAAEDLNFGTSLSWWNGPKIEVDSARGCTYDLQYGNQSIPCSLCDVEVEHQWGAVYLVGLPAPLDILSNKRRSNLPFVRNAHEQKALVCYQAGWFREVLIDALLGYVDVVNVCNNNFHRHKYQPRRQYANLLNVKGFPEYPNTPQGMLEMNFEAYYRLLNCGLRLAPVPGQQLEPRRRPWDTIERTFGRSQRI